MVDYGANSAMQSALVASKAGVLRDLVGRIGPLDRPFIVEDYGCGPARSAIDVVRPIVEAYRALSDGPVVVRHADQPGNDWSGLVALAFGPDGYHATSGVRTEAVVGSFYDELATPGSVNLATSFAACHWLSRPTLYASPGTVFFADLEEPARSQMAALARADWTRFLRLRAREMTAGGHALFASLGASDRVVSAAKLYRAISTVAQAMTDEGLLRPELMDRFVFPVWFRTEAELVEPLLAEPDLRDAFEVIEATVRPSATNPDDVFANEIDDPATYGRLYAGYVRGFAESSMRLHLVGPSAASEAETDALLEEFFQRFGDFYAAAPGQHNSQTLIATLVLRRR